MVAVAGCKEILALKEYIEKKYSDHYNGVLINLYRDGKDYVSWHNDSEKDLCEYSSIASCSFFEERKFSVREKEDRSNLYDYHLSDNSFLVMEYPTNTYFEHTIRKTLKSVGFRINLTFRRFEAVEGG
jgi:alkylated DNA repair dioxygenase AlkB